MNDLLLHPVSVVIVYAVACCGLMAIGARAEQPVLLPRPICPAAAATRSAPEQPAPGHPADVRAVETIQRIYLSDGTVQEKSLGVVSLTATDDFHARH